MTGVVLAQVSIKELCAHNAKILFMELTLASQIKIKDVKKQFSHLLPFLKLEFYPSRHQKGASSLMEEAIPDGTPLSEVSSSIKEAAFSFTPLTTVAEFEQRLQDEWGLSVQVFRKAGTLWLETVQTDNWSLEKQNAIGEKDSTPARFNLYTLFL